ncbi:hypothetical protein UFOVP273_124 [uncultured Caudovirales phage]|uniref:Uncharacterized protein n=1 Tax=uncultured Caudovirales phage TaxID=2100421 RepID=A0A6J5LJZ4_9CAUD|nr:hypothetical protein UFOVP273_124 [uncultured Caudovirales phage]
MGKKQFWVVIDTETTVEDTVADFGAVIVDRTGKVHAQCGVLLAGHFDGKELFYDHNATGLWAKAGAEKRRAHYVEMLNNGSRMMASVAAVNRWLEKVSGKYDPEMTAYNLAFDVSKCANTGIDLSMFSRRFCLWQASVGNICNSKAFKQFALENHAFNSPTQKRNMTFQTNAEIVSGFLNGQFVEEPHTALEDAMNFEVPILAHILKKKGWKEKITPYDWNKFQVRDHFAPK